MEELEPTSQNKPERDEKGRLLPGNTANPAGRPRGSISITEKIRQKLLEVPEGQRKPYLDILVSKILKKAILDGDFMMIKQVWNYVDGMPKIGIDSTTKSEVVVSQDVNLLEKLLLTLDYDTRNKINAKLLEIADEQGGDSKSGLQDRPLFNDRKGNLSEEGSDKGLETGESASGLEPDVDGE